MSVCTSWLCWQPRPRAGLGHNASVQGGLWLDHREMETVACSSQTYSLHSLSFAESGVLLAMACDHFIAIWNPLRYASKITNTQVLKTGLGVLMRGFVPVFPLISPLMFFPIVKPMSFPFCLHQLSSNWPVLTPSPSSINYIQLCL